MTYQKIAKGMYESHDYVIPREYLPERMVRKIAYLLHELNITINKNNIKNPVFVVGSGRSGTTLMMKSIEKNKAICSYPGEALDLWYPYNFPWVNSNLEAPPYWIDPLIFTNYNLNKWNEKDTQKLKRIFSNYFALSRGKFFLNKCAMTAHLIPHILKVYPDAKFIHIYRDGRAVALSYAKITQNRYKTEGKIYTKKGYLFDFDVLLIKMAELWNHQILSMNSDIKKLELNEKNKIIEVRYEEFCEKPKEITNKIEAFMGVEPSKLINEKINPAKNNFEVEVKKVILQKMTAKMQEGLRLKGYL